MKKLLLILVFIQVCFSCTQDAQICADKELIDTTIICDSIYNPVCGCDNNTYYNACEALNKGGLNMYSIGQCAHTCTYNDTLIVLATDSNCTILTDFIHFYEVDYTPENTVWEKDKYYLINAVASNKTPNCGGSESINILCVLLYDQSCKPLIATSGIDNQLPNDSLHIDQIGITNNCLNVDYSYLGGCDDTRLNLHHLIDSSTTDLIRLELRYDNGNGPCDEVLTNHVAYNLSSLQTENQNSITILINCNGDDSFNEMINYEY